MMALTLTQPWASLVAIGAKQWETRSWPAKFRGSVAIHAAKGYSAADRELSTSDPYFVEALKVLPFLHAFAVAGRILAVADLTDCRPTSDFWMPGYPHTPTNAIVISDREAAFGNYSEGRYAFKLENIRQLTPIPCKGALGFWSVPSDIEAAIRKGLSV
jgi:hypothetical protein